jgi:hypothetical protein
VSWCVGLGNGDCDGGGDDHDNSSYLATTTQLLTVVSVLFEARSPIGFEGAVPPPFPTFSLR